MDTGTSLEVTVRKGRRQDSTPALGGAQARVCDDSCPTSPRAQATPAWCPEDERLGSYHEELSVFGRGFIVKETTDP